MLEHPYSNFHYNETKSELESVRNTEITLKEAHDHESALSVELDTLRKQVVELEEKNRNEVSGLKQSISDAVEKHRTEIADLIKEHDEIIATARQQQAIELQAATARFEQAREEADGLRLKNETLEKQLEELDETYTKEKEEIEVKLRDQETARQERTDNDMAELRESYSRLCESNDNLKKQLDALRRETKEQLEE
ncbi:hypothetical protein ANCCAN_13915 [Ancylostoma caninum]|uniref:Uncharacterized protein n=1 Tax=Ancylostoma caninum TaxID=29170 RepID=A0A368G6S0_ANCCA|nr:hypothetical protein ANCCAN_13915 [Ancylostoma caninum]